MFIVTLSKPSIPTKVMNIHGVKLLTLVVEKFQKDNWSVQVDQVHQIVGVNI